MCPERGEGRSGIQGTGAEDGRFVMLGCLARGNSSLAQLEKGNTPFGWRCLVPQTTGSIETPPGFSPCRTSIFIASPRNVADSQSQRSGATGATLSFGFGCNDVFLQSILVREYDPGIPCHARHDHVPVFRSDLIRQDVGMALAAFPHVDTVACAEGFERRVAADRHQTVWHGCAITDPRFALLANGTCAQQRDG